MKVTLRNLAVLATVLVVVAFVSSKTQAQQGRPPSTDSVRVNEAQLDKWMQELSNWGRWGKDDVLGALNTITPEKRRQAALLVRTGETVSLSHDLVIGGTKTEFVLPFFLQMRIVPERQVVRDRQDIDPHGNGGGSHLDALCHMAYKGKFYNGIPFEQVTAEKGCKLGINNLKDGIITRAVLIDMPRLRNVASLERGTHVYREDIEAWEKLAGVKVAPGDVLLLRTQGSGGYDASFLPFLKDRDVAVLGSDTAQDVGVVPGCTNTAPGPTMCWLPVHKFALVARGMHLFDGLDLEAVANTAARLKRWEFMLMAAPIRVPGGSGAPINPIAIF